MVEEWFKKMQPPLGSPPPLVRNSTPSPVCFDALNLSVKVTREDTKSAPPKPVETGSASKSAPIYLRPMVAIQGSIL
jgi:hypothetical protein